MSSVWDATTVERGSEHQGFNQKHNQQFSPLICHIDVVRKNIQRLID